MSSTLARVFMFYTQETSYSEGLGQVAKICDNFHFLESIRFKRHIYGNCSFWLFTLLVADLVVHVLLSKRYKLKSEIRIIKPQKSNNCLSCATVLSNIYNRKVLTYILDNDMPNGVLPASLLWLFMNLFGFSVSVSFDHFQLVT